MGVVFDIDPAATALPLTARPEPMLTATLFPGEFTEPDRLDPGRAQAEPAARPLRSRQKRLTFGLAGSLGVHLLPLLLLVHWSSAPPEITAPIPVQLVFETPPAPPPPAPPAPEKKPPPGRLASEDMGEVAAKPNPPAAAAEEAVDRPDETVVAAVQPPPDPTRPPKLVSALPKPTPPAEAAAVAPEPKPTPPVMRRLKHAAVARLTPNPQPAGHARVPGPAATRDEYLAYCSSLVRRHLGPLLAYVAGRRGAAVLRLQVLGDGTIARIAVERGSPYPDIDARIEQAVAAVRRFPPVPQWFQGPSIDLTLHVGYPEGL